jgi:hypothetical protein
MWMISSARKFTWQRQLHDQGHHQGVPAVQDQHQRRIVPARLEDLRLPGFSILDKFFVETRMIFGAVALVFNFDIVGSVPYLLAKIESGIPSSLVCRAVDDVTAISPASIN